MGRAERRLAAGLVVAATVGLAASQSRAAAGIVDRIRAEGVVHCGAVERPGIAEELPNENIGGIALDVCRALAVAVLGPEGKVSFSLYDAPKTFDAVRSGEDEIAFLTGGEIASADLGAAVVPGPTVAVTEVGVMVHDPAPIHGIAELGGRRVCVMTGSRAQPAFESAMARLHLSPLRLAFEEDVELLDAYNSGACEAAVGEVTYLADMRRNTGINKEPSRLLPEALASDPIIAVTPQADGPWAASVRWVFDAMLLADAPADAWRASGADALPARTPPGLRPNWRDDVIATVGSYGAVVHRDFTVNLGLPPGPNALWPAGALLPPALR